jgi:hypothetical protein
MKISFGGVKRQIVDCEGVPEHLRYSLSEIYRMFCEASKAHESGDMETVKQFFEIVVEV